VVITVASSGMGRATTNLLGKFGAEIYDLGRNRVTILVKRHIVTDLRNKDPIDASVELIPGNFYELFNCAGVRLNNFSKLDVVLTLCGRHATAEEQADPLVFPPAIWFYLLMGRIFMSTPHIALV